MVYTNSKQCTRTLIQYTCTLIQYTCTLIQYTRTLINVRVHYGNDFHNVRVHYEWHRCIGSAAMFRKLTNRSADQWVDSIINACWSDPSNPAPTGGEHEDPKTMAHAMTPYWQSVFSAKATIAACVDTCRATLRRGNRVLPPTADKCDAPISEKEITSTCNTLQTGKSPGPDRLPNKFYKTFSATVGPILEKVYEESRTRGHLPPGVSEGTISLLYKKKERNDPRNYRPITLLNRRLQDHDANPSPTDERGRGAVRQQGPDRLRTPYRTR